MRQTLRPSLRAASGLALAAGLTLVVSSPLRAHGLDAPATAVRAETAEEATASLWAKAAADNPAIPVKQATPKDPRVWAPLIHQTYPREAALAGLEGSVRIRVIVDAAGRVSDCFVLQSSGHVILDQAACDGMRRFAVFNPASDASGSPTVGSYSTIITYRMRTPQPSLRPPIPTSPSAPTI